MKDPDENKQIVCSLYQLLEKNKMDEYMSKYDQNAVWIEPEGSPFGGTYRGKAEIEELLTSAFTDWWREFEIELDQIICEDDTVVVIATEKGTYDETGKYMEARASHIYTVKDGYVTRMESILDSVKMKSATISESVN